MHRNGKPVRKCHGCGLNFRDHCGVYSNPHEMWHSRKVCPGYMNEELLAEYQAEQAREDAKLRKKEVRKAVTQQRQSVPHRNGDRHVAFTGH